MKPKSKEILDKIGILNGQGVINEKANKVDLDDLKKTTMSRLTDTTMQLKKRALITDIPTSLPANGGNSNTVGGKSATDFQPVGNYASASHSHTKNQISNFPTKLSQFDNEPGFITESGAPVQSVNGKKGFVELKAADIRTENWETVESYLAETTKQIENIMQKTTKDLKYYVATTGSDSNDGLTGEKPFRTLAKAVSMLPQVINHMVKIIIAEGVYNEPLILKGFSGGGDLQVISEKSYTMVANKEKNVLDYFLFRGNTVRLYVMNLTLNNSHGDAFANNAISVFTCSHVLIGFCTLKHSTSTTFRTGIDSIASNVYVQNCDITEYKEACIEADEFSNVYSYDNKGNGLGFGLKARVGSTIVKRGTQPSGFLANEKVEQGGIIR